mgnify:CR=1 FL=1
MNPRQRKFAEFYAGGLSGAEAARQAGYSPNSARAIANKLLTKSDVKNYVNQLQEAARSEAVADCAEVCKVLTDILRDPRQRASSRVRAGEVLMRSVSAASTVDNGGETDEDETVKFLLPYNGRGGDVNCIILPNGDYLPLPGHEEDQILICIPYGQPIPSETAPDDDDEPAIEFIEERG